MFMISAVILTIPLFTGYLNLTPFRTDIFSGAVLSVFFPALSGSNSEKIFNATGFRLINNQLVLCLKEYP